MRLTRRTALGLLAAGGAMAAYGGYSWSQAGLSASARPLQIPPLDTGVMSQGRRSFDLTLSKGTSRFVDDLITPTFGINGDYLGPTLKFTAGETVSLSVFNTIGEASTLHWHGFHLPASADGGPHQVIGNDASWYPSFEVKQNAGTFWYHSHMVPRTGYQVYHGLAGLILVEDERAGNLGLPQDYGVDDIPLVLQDRRFRDNGSLEYATAMPDRMMGMFGNTLLVNGTINAYFAARTDTLRLRILNGSNARMYTLAFSDGRSFHQIASDGGLLESPVRTNAITLGPAERAEIIVDVSDGRPVILQSTTPSQGGGMMNMMMADRTSFDVLEIRPDEGRKNATVLPERLVTLETPDPAAAVRTRKFTLGMGMGMGMGMMGGGGGEMTINGRSMDMNRIDEVVRVGTEEIWIIDNPTMLTHPFHIHDVQFRILDRNGSPPSPAEAGLKDTVVVPPGEQARLLLQFADYTDPDSPYMYHCHNLEHEDAGMMGQFTVVA
ncbi:Multicopper oxidase [hydrothermal vent metagenome]|uniref:Multicopper oxidase CueO n=1 Tax=hydrothermal vent metagenome TaxID=652676 RepID=A0A3B0TK07_9ZZZZ